MMYYVYLQSVVLNCRSRKFSY